MPSWIGQAYRRGSLTTRYPHEPATADELPLTARAPGAPGGATLRAEAMSSCPVDAIAADAVDQGRCIRCARCLAHGLQFLGPAEVSAAGRRALAGALPDAASSAPLSELGRSLHLFLVDVGSCNACNLEVLGLASPYYDLQRLGLFFTNSPRHADVLVVVGVPTDAMLEPLRRAYEALPEPKAVVAVGACAISGGVFAGGPGLRAGLEGLIPVDRWVPGCPPTPVQILDAVRQLAGRGRRER